MTKSSDSSSVGREKPKKRFFGIFFSGLISSFFLGLLIMVLINIYKWASLGYEKMLQNLKNNYQIESSELFIRNKDIASYSIATIEYLGNYFTKLDIQIESKLHETKVKGHIPFFDSATEKAEGTNHFRSAFSGLLIEAGIKLKQLAVMFWFSLALLLLKMVSIYAAFLLYVFASVLGILDGLVKRYIRTVEGGRESTFIFHRISEIIIKTPIWLVAIYLISPFFINPTWIITLMAASFFLAFRIFTSSLKKFL